MFCAPSQQGWSSSPSHHAVLTPMISAHHTFGWCCCWAVTWTLRWCSESPYPAPADDPEDLTVGKLHAYVTPPPDDRRSRGGSAATGGDMGEVAGPSSDMTDAAPSS